MSNTITAYFKGRKGVAESLYQNDYGMVMVFYGIELPAHFDCYFSIQNQEEAVPGVGADNRVAIPNSVLANPGKVEIHIPLHTGSSDSEVEYVVYFRVIGRARPVDDGTPAQMTAIERALALLSQPITNIEEIVNEALSFTGDTFAEMKQELEVDFDEYTETLEGDLATWKGGVESDIDDVEHDFTVLQNQFDTAVAAVSTDTELTDIRVGDDEVTYTTAGLAVRTQFSNLKSALTESGTYDAIAPSVFTVGSFVTSAGGVSTNSDFAMTSPIDLKKGETIEFYGKGYSTNVSMIAYKRLDGTDYFPLVTCLDSTAKKYRYTAFTDMQVVLSSNKSELNVINIYHPISIESSETEDRFLSSGMLTYYDLDTDAESGVYISASNGSKLALSGFYVSAPFLVKENSKLFICAQGYANNVAIVALYDSVNETYTPLVASVSGEKFYEYTASKDITVVVSYNGAFWHTAQSVYNIVDNDNVIKNNIQTINDSIDEILMPAWENAGTLVEGKQVQVNNGNINIANGTSAYKYAVSDVSNIDRVRIVCYAGTSPQWTVGYIFATSSGAVVSQYNNTSGEYTLEVDVPNGATMLYANNNGYGTTPSIAKEIKVAEHEYFDLSLFPKFGVVGDSYASGELYYGGAYTDKYNISWGQILARKHGITCTNYSKGGLSTRSWLTDNKGLSLMLSSPAEDLYLLALGINDYYQEGQAYLGDITDITSHQSYEDYGDTFYGNYGRIIEQIQTHAPHAKIVMFTVANTNTVPQMFSDAIIEIAEHYNIPYVVQASDSFFQSTIYTTMSGGHPTAVAYSGMATAFERLLDKCVKDNLSYFFNTFMYN